MTRWPDFGVRYYYRDGTPITGEHDEILIEWGKLMEDDSYRRVAYTKVGEVEVSTVWLGLNHRTLPPGPPLIFETMIFGGEHDQDQARYSTEAEARAGHELAVAGLKAELSERDRG